MRKPSSEILVADTDSDQVLRLAILKTILRKKTKKRDNNNNSSKPQQKSKHRLQQVVDYQHGNHLKEGTQILIFCQTSKRCEKK